MLYHSQKPRFLNVSGAHRFHKLDSSTGRETGIEVLCQLARIDVHGSPKPPGCGSTNIPANTFTTSRPKGGLVPAWAVSTSLSFARMGIVMGCTKQDVVEASDTADAKWDYIGLKPSFFKKVDADLLGLVGLIDQGEPSDILAVEALRILKEWEYEYDPDFPGRISPGEKLVPPQWQAYYDDPSWRKFYKQLPCGLFGNIHSDEQAGLQYAAFVDLMLSSTKRIDGLPTQSC